MTTTRTPTDRTITIREHFGRVGGQAAPILNWAEADSEQIEQVTPISGDLSPTEWIIEHQLPEKSCGLLFGESAAHKTFYVIGLGLSVAAGHEFFGCRVGKAGKGGRGVLYLAGEGSETISARARAYWYHELGARTDVSRFYPVDGIPDILTDDGRDELVYMAQGRDAGLIIVDTLARGLHGRSDASATIASRYMDRVAEIVKVTGASVILVHHVSDRGRGGLERGSSAWRASSDFMLSVTKGNSIEPGRVAVSKMKAGKDSWYAGIATREVLVPDMAPNSLGGGNTTLVVSQDQSVKPPKTIRQIMEEHILDLLPASNRELTEVLAPVLRMSPYTARDRVAEVTKGMAARGWITRDSQKAPWLRADDEHR